MKKFIILAHSANHYFKLAEFLNKKNLLHKIISIYPKFRLKVYKLPRDRVKFLFFPFLIFMIKKFLKFNISNIFYSDILNFSSKFYLQNKNAKILIGSSGYCLKSIQKARKENILSVVDRACPHIEYQKKLIFNELDKLPILNPNKIKKNYFDNKIIDQMLKEYDQCDFISVPSNFSYNSFRSYGLEKKLIFNQLTPEKILNLKNTKNKNNDELEIFSIGFNFIRKGFYYLIEAMKLLENTKIKLNLRTIKPDFLDIRNIPNNVNLIEKHISNKELENYYNNADLIILPSIDEGFGMVALEAMCLKKPVLITQNVGMKDVLTKYLKNSENYIINPGNIEELTNKILNIYDNKPKLVDEGNLFFQAANKYLENDIFKGYINL